MYIFSPNHSKIFEGYDIIHFHTTKEFFWERRSTKNFKGKVVLTSHSPMPLSSEIFEYLKQRAPRFLTGKWLLTLLRRNDRIAFKHADYITFPCPEAMEPYYNRWNEFASIIEPRKSDIRYVITGITPQKANISKEEIRRQIGIPKDAFVCCYVGRHNEVKGYDLLKSIGNSLLKINPEVYSLIAGKEYPITRLNHSHWIEVGYTTDLYSYMATSDVFLLPNRETYFDLVAIEALSLGKIIIASRTCGNKYYERKKLSGVFLYDTIDEAVSLINTLILNSLNERKKMENENQQIYFEKLTTEIKYNQYNDMYAEISRKVRKIKNA